MGKRGNTVSKIDTPEPLFITKFKLRAGVGYQEPSEEASLSDKPLKHDDLPTVVCHDPSINVTKIETHIREKYGKIKRPNLQLSEPKNKKPKLEKKHFKCVKSSNPNEIVNLYDFIKPQDEKVIRKTTFTNIKNVKNKKQTIQNETKIPPKAVKNVNLLSFDEPEE